MDVFVLTLICSLAACLVCGCVQDIFLLPQSGQGNGAYSMESREYAYRGLHRWICLLR